MRTRLSSTHLPELQEPEDELVSYGSSVIEIEAAALALLSRSLDQSFAAAVDMLLALSGRMVVTGMGKSGHVARKIAATLASTGSPSLYIHPGEAAHGDLGMLVPGDGLLVLSNSGGTSELRPVIAHAKALGIAIIGIAGRANSPLMQAADIRLLLPRAAEACPANIAPTTSTAMMMALGDALAMATMRQRGISRDGFEALHPGGTIGLRLMRVAAVMHKDGAIPLVAADAPMREVIVTMTAMSFGIAGVVDGNGHLIGAISDGDLRRHAEVLLLLSAGEVMTRSPVTIGACSFAEDALALMNEHKITSLFVTEDGDAERPIGLVHIHDFLRLGLA